MTELTNALLIDLSFVKSWLQRMWPDDPEARAFYDNLFEKFVKVLLHWKDVEGISEPVPISDFEAVSSADTS